ncbi:hypothetical protein [Methylobacterium radiodurans]|uniref:Uncharacterized protein n=1 Tax=Methylobacterium radiodurans TaxID=2202828 RepID=A0A2U8VN47_9HYPH|nr:hypothetical protein [Methylobacterium radiodurans]AWN34898.1 hypothetical protein DK427_03370 [Methylobacterium radiodurans]
MQTSSSKAQAGQAGLFEARLARSGGPSINRRRGGLRPGEPGRGRLGWKAWLVIDAVGLVLFLAVVVVWPPLSTCREKAREYGLYAGDTIEKCTRRGLAERFERADQRVKMLIRSSGH